MFDSFVIEKVCTELTSRIVGHRVQRISQLAKDKFAFKFSSTRYLMIDLSSESYHLSLVDQKPIDQSQITGLYTGLRKHLTGAKLVSITQLDFDRTIELRFTNLNSIMEPVVLTLYLEMMGRHANAILVDQEQLVIQALKFSDLDQHPVMMGHPYSVFAPRKLDPFTADADFTQALDYKGFTRALLKLLPDDVKRMSVAQASQWIKDSQQPSLYLDEERYRDYHLFANGELALVETVDIFQAINQFYAQRPNQSRTSQINNYRQSIHQRQKQLTEKLQLLQETTREFEQAELFKDQADILYANLYAIKPYQDAYEGVDFNNQPVSIPLDPKKSVTQNAQELYERYQKMTRGKVIVREQIEMTEKDIAIMDQLAYDLDNITQTQDLDEFEAVLSQHGLIKAKKKQSQPTKSKPMEVFYRDVKYTIGRNSFQNDQLISKNPHRDHVWFHAQDIPGSHVVMHLSMNQADEDLIHYGAVLAAGYSKAGPGVKIPVDYIRLGQLKKPKGAAPGFVTFQGQTTISVIGQIIESN